MSVVYTYGYLRGSVRELQAHATRLDAMVVDVRFVPRSRGPEWNRDRLEVALGKRYRWCRAFGNELYQTQDIRLHDPERGLREVGAILAERPVILLCMCPVAETCHRATAAAYVAERLGLEVVHLGVAPPDQLKLF